MDIKKPKTFSWQLDKLRERGCIIDDESFAADFLQHVNYYRFTAYFLPFKKRDGSYVDGTSFYRIAKIYEFEQKMRTLLFSIIEEIEIMLRTQLSYFHAHKYGGLGYMLGKNFNSKHKHYKFLGNVVHKIGKNQNCTFVKHHIEHYNGNFPLWVIVELFSLGELSYFYADLLVGDRKEIARQLFGSSESNVTSWLICANVAYFLKEYGAQFDRQIILITHNADLAEIGEISLDVKRNAGGESEVVTI